MIADYNLSIYNLVFTMSYQVIARKWRPQTFEEVTGQEIITQTLRNALEHDRLHHAYLFSGARGVGKTTTARILAKALNCHKTTGKPNLSPCLLDDPTACPSCIEISESRSIDVLEIDAASHTGIDDVRETIIENINFNPTRDRYRVFIIDEVHQLSKAAFNALLKTLEEPPENVVFIMATTELHKVPDTILSRCQEFEFRTIPLQKIFDRLKLIADTEKINIDTDALRELARSGTGSMRDAQSNFDQVISFSGEQITSQDVTNALGFAGVEVLSKTISSITDKDKQAALAVVDDLIGRGHDLRNFCRDVLALIRDLLVFKVAGDSSQLFETAVFNVDQMRSMSAAFSEADLLRFFNSLCETEASLREAAHPRYVLEIGLIKLIEMRSVATIESILEQLSDLKSGAGGTSSRPGLQDPAAAAARATAGVDPVAVEEKKTLKSEPEPVFAEDNDDDLIPEPPVEDYGFDENVVETRVVETPAVEPRFSPEWIASVAAPTILPPLPPEDLEHIEDQRLDDAYEQKLVWTGDDLLPILDAGSWIEELTGIKRPVSPHTTASNGHSAAAAAPAVDVASIRPELADDEPIEIPVLSTEPTEEDLIAYAAAHQNVRTAMRVFRGKIVEVKRA